MVADELKRGFARKIRKNQFTKCWSNWSETRATLGCVMPTLGVSYFGGVQPLTRVAIHLQSRHCAFRLRDTHRHGKSVSSRCVNNFFHSLLLSENRVQHDISIKKLKTQFCWEIKHFVKNHICKWCVTLRSRVARGVYVLTKDLRRRSPLAPAINSTRVNRVMRGISIHNTVTP